MAVVEPILIRRRTLRDMARHARDEYPWECCGLMWGRGKVIEGIVRTGNAKRSGTEFEIEPRELFDFMKKSRRDSRDFMGIYHSHPDGSAVPSARDAAEFHYRDVSYWIVSLRKGRAETRSYRWLDGDFREAPYRSLD